MVEQGLFSKYMGKLAVEIDGKTLELDVRLKDKQKIMSLSTKFQDKINEETLQALTAVYMEILKRSYPDTPESEFEGFLLHKSEDFMTALSIAFGWTTKEKIDADIEKRKKQGE
jgi:hypothetical protein